MSKVKQSTLTIAYALMVLIAVIGGLFLYHGTTAYPPLDAPALALFSTKYSIPAAASVILIAYLGFGKALFRLPHRWLIILGIILASFILGLAFAYQYNGGADGGPLATKTLPIIDKRKLIASGSTSYYLVVASWRKDRLEERIRISEDEFQFLILPAKVTFSLKPGSLGFPWVHSYSLLQSKQLN